MKLFKIIPLLLMSALAVSGCGGTVNATIGGTVVGLASGNSVGLTNNGTDTISYSFNSSSNSFTFDKSVASGSAYSVTVTTQPAGQVCSVTNASGTVTSNGGNVTNVLVTCTTGSGTTVPLTVSFVGLAAGQTLMISDVSAGTLTLTGTAASASGTTVSANFPFSLAPGSVYNAKITSQPTTQNCTILNTSGAGTVPASGDPSPVAVSCG